MGYDHVRVEPGEAARIVLDRPPLNVLTIAMLEELGEAIRTVAASPGTRAMVLTGAGKAFCAGVDVADHTADRVRSMIGSFSAVVRALLDVEVPVVAVLNGAALGGGLELALACDIVLAREGAKLGQPEIRLGVFPPAAAALLPRRVGPQHAMDLVLSGRTVSAEEARAMGLVSLTLPAEGFDDAVGDYLTRLSGSSRPVLRLAKRAVKAGLERPLAEALRLADRVYLDDLMALHDPHEGLAAFMEKREPVWKDA